MKNRSRICKKVSTLSDKFVERMIMSMQTFLVILVALIKGWGIMKRLSRTSKRA